MFLKFPEKSLYQVVCPPWVGLVFRGEVRLADPVKAVSLCRIKSRIVWAGDEGYLSPCPRDESSYREENRPAF